MTLKAVRGWISMFHFPISVYVKAKHTRCRGCDNNRYPREAFKERSTCDKPGKKEDCSIAGTLYVKIHPCMMTLSGSKFLPANNFTNDSLDLRLKVAINMLERASEIFQ